MCLLISYPFRGKSSFAEYGDFCWNDNRRQRHHLAHMLAGNREFEQQHIGADQSGNEERRIGWKHHVKFKIFEPVCHKLEPPLNFTNSITLAMSPNETGE